MHKLGASLSTIPNESKHYYENLNLSKSNDSLSLPYK